MSWNAIRQVAVCLTCSLMLSGTESEDIRALEAKLIQARLKYKGIAYKVRFWYRDKNGTQHITKGTYEELIDGEQLLFREEFRSFPLQQSGGQAVRREGTRSVNVCDGEYVYKHIIGYPVVWKSHYDNRGHPRRVFERRREGFELRLLPDEEIDEGRVYVIEGTPRRSRNPRFAQCTWYYGEDGILRKKVWRDENGELFDTVEYTEIRLNTKPDRSHFVFNPPDDVEIKEVDYDEPIQIQLRGKREINPVISAGNDTSD